jgi:hypothetical protein
MESVLGWSFMFIAIALAGYMGAQAARGRRPLLSVRNFFLTGLILFQLTSAASMYFADHYGEIPPNDPIRTGMQYLAAISVFLILFLVAYDRGWLTFHIQNRIRVKTPAPGTGATALASISCLVVASVCQLMLKNIGLIGVLAEIVGVGLAAVSAGMAAWTWAARPKNLVLLGFFLMILAIASAISLYEEFGRRSLLGVLFAATWGAYQGGFRYFNWRRAALPLSVLAVLTVILLAAITSTRGQEGKGTNLGETLRRLQQANIEEGLMSLLSGQDAAPNSMWVIENRPEPFPYEPLNSIYYCAVNAVPRAIWENKPVALGTEMVRQSMVGGKGPEYSVGAGLIGHIYNDNPWLALPIYALLLAAWFRIMDDLVARYGGNALVIVPLGAELGEILGFPRGELGFFMFRAIVGMSAGLVVCFLVARVLRSVGFAFAGSQVPVDEHAPEYGDPTPALDETRL